MTGKRRGSSVTQADKLLWGISYLWLNGWQFSDKAEVNLLLKQPGLMCCR